MGRYLRMILNSVGGKFASVPSHLLLLSSWRSPGDLTKSNPTQLSGVGSRFSCSGGQVSKKVVVVFVL